MNSHYQTGLRNLLDRAISRTAISTCERTCRKVDEIPFDFQRRRMSVVIDYQGVHVLICKGAVEEIFRVCSHYQVDDDIYPLIDMLKQDLLEEYEDLSRDGFRVVAIAYREFPAGQGGLHSGRRERADPARLPGVLRSAEGNGHRRARGAAQDGRRHQDPDG